MMTTFRGKGVYGAIALGRISVFKRKEASVKRTHIDDIEAEKARLNKELAAVQKDLDFVNNKLSNENFVAKAPANVVAAQREQAEKYAEKIAMLKDSIAKLG